MEGTECFIFLVYHKWAGCFSTVTISFCKKCLLFFWKETSKIIECLLVWLPSDWTLHISTDTPITSYLHQTTAEEKTQRPVKLSIFTLIRCYTCGYFHEPRLEDSRCSKLRKHFDILLSQNLFEYALAFTKKAANKVLSCLNRGWKQQ